MENKKPSMRSITWLCEYPNLLLPKLVYKITTGIVVYRSIANFPGWRLDRLKLEKPIVRGGLETRNLKLVNGAGDGIRTRDVLLGRQALCH
jgi:hypothetical protein